MNNGYKKILWGLIFTTFHINLGVIQILPTFVGYIIVYFGIDKIVKDYKLNSLEKSSKYCSILALMSFISVAMPFSGLEVNNSIFNIIWSNTFQVIELFMVYKLLEGSIEILEKSNNQLWSEYNKKVPVYIILYTVFIVLSNINQIFMIDGLIAGITLLALCIRIWITIVIGKLSKLQISTIQN